MFRAAPRLIARPSALRALPRSTQICTPRFISTAPPHHKSRSWKSLVGRVGIVGAIIYFYNTTEVFAEEPRHAVHQVQPATEEDLQTEFPTIEALAKERAQRKAELVAEKERALASEAASTQGNVAGGEEGVQGLEEEAGQQGAFNPETGEINWDCPCLGGMATGPCGEQFKAAFSCFVHSTEEPKGMDCVDKFKDMQNCFREYPEVYGNELEGDEDDDVPGDDELAALSESESAPSEKAEASRPASERRTQEDRAQAEVQQRKKEQVLGGSDEVIPREAHDDRVANAGKKSIQEKEQ